MNEPFDFDEAQIAAALQASVQSEPVNLLAFDQLVARSRRSGQRNVFAIGGAVVLAAAAAGAGVLLLRQNTDDQAARLELGTRGGSSSSLITNSSQSSSSLATDSSSSAIAVAADPSSSASSSSVPVATIAGEREYILAVLDGRVAILNRQGKLVRDYGEVAASNVRITTAPTKVWIVTNGDCGSDYSAGLLKSLDLVSGTVSELKSFPNGYVTGISPDGKLAAVTQDCGGVGFFRLDQPGIPEIQEEVPVAFSFEMMDDGMSLSVPIARTEGSDCPVIVDYKDTNGDPNRILELIRNAVPAPAPDGKDCTRSLDSHDAGGTGERRSGEYLEAAYQYADGDGETVRIELVAADGSRTGITQYRKVVDAEWIPAGTDLGVLTPPK